MTPNGRACHRCVKVKERVQLYHYSTVLSWHVTGELSQKVHKELGAHTPK